MVPGAEVLALRMRHGYTRREFSTLVGVGMRTVEGWEHRETPVFAMKLLRISIIMDKLDELGTPGGAYAKLIQDIRDVIQS